MNYLSLLTDDEAHYICSVIPYEHIIIYFRKNPKELAKIRPGFRAQAISKTDAIKLLFNYRSRESVSYFIEKHISDWLSQIQAHITICMDDGDSKDLAIIHTLPLSLFAGNVELYFKLASEENDEEHISLLSTTIKAIKEAIDRQERLNEELKAKETGIRKLQADLYSTKSDFDRTSTKLQKRSAEIESLKHIISDLQKQRSILLRDIQVSAVLEEKIQVQDRTIKTLIEEVSDVKKLHQQLAVFETKVKDRDDTIQELNLRLHDAINSVQQLEAQIRVEFEKQQTVKIDEQPSSLRPKCPKDKDEFKDCLGYNFADIGVPQNTEYYHLLKEYLGSILFNGIPIVVNRGIGISLMKCVANTLIGRSKVKTLVFSQDTSIEEVVSFLSSEGRILCLDNFIGNCNEMELLPLFDHHQDKIIFLTVAYERTLHYVAREFLRYCHYLNANRITALYTNAELTEEPSTIEEVEYEPQSSSPNIRYSTILRDILGEFDFDQSLVEKKCATIFNERDLCCFLAFDVLPYCTDVMEIAPYQKSEKFLKYAGDNGRCPHKKLLKEWFGQ